jgi:hypothetical protein
VEFDAVANAGVFLPGDASNPYGAVGAGHFVVQVGSQGWPRGYITRTPNGTEYVTMPAVAQPVLFEVRGMHSRNNGNGPTGANYLEILGNGREIEHKNGTGPLRYAKKVVLDVPANHVHYIKIRATAYANGFVYVDPVVTPHPDNPEVNVTLRGAIDPDPQPLAIFSPEELTAAGIDLAPLEDMGLLPSGPSVEFLSPLPDASYKQGAAIRARLRMVDADGIAIPDAVAKGLTEDCRVKIGLDTATSCVRYNARKDAFLFAVKVPKEASLGAHEVVAEVLGDDGAVEESAAVPVTVRARGRSTP